MNTKRFDLYFRLILGLGLITLLIFTQSVTGLLVRDEARLTLGDLPSDAQASILAALGQDNPTYHFVKGLDGTFRMANGGLRADLSTVGVRVQTGESQFTLALVGFGYGDQLQVVATAQPHATANRVEYAREGINEWYVNGPLGLEQGFTLAEPPGGQMDGEPLTLSLAANGLTAQLDSDRRGLMWVNEAGYAVLHYHGLTAFDADGQSLPAWLEVEDQGMLQIRVDDASARYPLTIDPFIELAKLTASDGAGFDEFGWSVALSDDTFVVGAMGDDSGKGSAYIFIKPSGGWTTTSTFNAKLTASDGAAGDQFGFSVAISGDTIVVGARLDDIGSNPNEGSAYIFTKPSGGWATTSTFNAKLTSAGGDEEQFGRSVAISGDTVVVGAPLDDSSAGAAYVFVKPSGGWVTTSDRDAKLTAADAADLDQFGNSVAISGDTVVVGAPIDDGQRGSAYVFVKPSNGWDTTSNFNAKLTASDGAGTAHFGSSVGINGDTVVIGARLDNIGSNPDQGSAYIFIKPSGGWTTTSTFNAKLTASDGAAGDQFGRSVAINGGTVVVGAPMDDSRKGAAYVFVKPSGGWATTSTFDAKLTASDAAAGDQIESSVAISGNTIAFGAPADDFTGSAYIFGNPGPVLTATPTPTGTNTPTFTPTFTPTALSGSNPLYLSLTGNGSVGGVASADEDILLFDGTTWSPFFDGSDVGLPAAADLFAFYNLDADTILMSFANNVMLGGVTYTPRDIARFDATSLGSTTAGTFSMYFNGVDVGLSAVAENIDALDVLPDGKVLISTTGNPTVIGVTGAADEDILAFTPNTLGNSTNGTWAMYFDGSDVGLSTTNNEDIDALDVTSNGNIYLSTLGDFAVTGVSGFDEDVFVCVPTSIGSVTACNYSSTLYFDGSIWGLSANGVDAINLLSTGPLPTNTPTATQSGPTNTPPVTETATQTPSSADLIFADGFESGNLSTWTSSSIDAGDLSASTAAALMGTRGMQAVINNNTSIFVTDDTPSAEPRYRARFYFDPNSIPMVSGDAHFIFKGIADTTTDVLQVELRQSSGAYQVRAKVLNDASAFVLTNWFTISDAPHFIEVDWRAATSAGANNGGVTLWIDGIQQVDLNTVDNDTWRIDRVRLGAVAGIDTGTRGTYYFDAFESRRQNYIGP